jgi:hypothetical protein
MAYRLVYQAWIDWVGPGTGVMSGNVAPALPMGGRGGAQTLEMSNAQGGQNTNTITSGTITTITNAMAADIAAQMNAQITRIQNFSTGTD